MPDMHISAQLVSALPPVTAAQGLPADAATPGGGADAFAALLAGKLAPQDAAAAAAQLLKTAAAAAGKAAATNAADLQDAAGLASAEAPADPLASKDAKAAKDSAEPADPALPVTPDATAQLLATLGAIPPAMQPAQEAAAGPEGTSTQEIAGAAPTPPGAGKPSAGPLSGKGEGDPPRTTERDTPAPEAGDAPAAPAGPAHAVAVEMPAAPAQPPAAPAAQPVASLSAPAPAVHMAVPGPVGTPLWREEFAASVSLLATQRVTSAELRVQPAEMGPVQVSIRIEGGEANISCAAQHADTRHALENALPRLREMLESNGISVGSASVGTHPQGSGNGADAWAGPAAQSRPASAPEAPDADTPAFLAAQSSRAYARSDRLLDVFA